MQPESRSLVSLLLNSLPCEPICKPHYQLTGHLTLKVSILNMLTLKVHQHVLHLCSNQQDYSPEFAWWQPLCIRQSDNTLDLSMLTLSEQPATVPERKLQLEAYTQQYLT